MENKTHLISGVPPFIQQTITWHHLCGMWQVAVIFFSFLALSTLFCYHFILAVK